MTIKIGSSSINSIYVGDTKVSAVYLGDQLVYGTNLDSLINKSYNYFIFDTSKVSDTTTVILQKYRAGDTTTWDGYTDWGDGAIDTSTSHTYAENGIYTVKTKYMINNSNYPGNDKTRKMFTECININQNIKTCMYLFSDCINLTYVNTKDFNTNNITGSMYRMFYFCESLTSLNLSNFDTSNVTGMKEMFYGCFNLTSLDLSNWNMDNVTNYTNMFVACNDLTIDNIIMTNCNDATKTKIQEALAAK